MRPTLISLGMGLGIAFGLSATASADTRVEMANEDGAHSVVYKIKDGKVRFEQSTDPGNIGLFNTNDGSMLMLDAHSKQYFKLDKQAADEMAGAMSEAMAEMKKRMAQLPPEQAEQMRRFMPNMGMADEAPKFTAERTGAKDEVGGIACEMVRVSRDGKPINENCVASLKDAGISKADHKTLRAMMEAMESFSKQMGGKSSSMSAELAAMDGLPVKSVDLVNGEVMSLKSLSTDKLDAAQFAVPEGYSKREMPRPQF